MNKFKSNYYDFAVSDFDGTIFRSDLTVSNRTINAVNNFINRGGTFCICTGRMTNSILRYCVELNLKGYLISYNGAEITQLSDNTLLFKEHVDNNACIKLLKYAEQNDYLIQVYPNNRLIVGSLSEESENYAKTTRVPLEVYGGRVSKLFEETKYSSAKVLFHANDAQAQKMIPEIKKLLGDEYNVIRSNAFHIDIMKKSVSKGNAIRKLARLLDLDMKKLICFGDEMNDKSMLEVAALSCLCSNGNEKLKNQVDLVIDSCDDDGVAKALEKLGV